MSERDLVKELFEMEVTDPYVVEALYTALRRSWSEDEVDVLFNVYGVVVRRAMGEVTVYSNIEPDAEECVDVNVFKAQLDAASQRVEREYRPGE